MASRDDVRHLGYTVGEAFTTPAETIVYRVEGFGLSMMVGEGDADALASLTDPAAHAERVAQQGETADEMLERWIAEGKVAPPN